MAERSYFTLKFSQQAAVQNRLYRVYEDERLVLKTTQVDELNGLKLSNDANVKIIIEPEITGLKLILMLILQLFTSNVDTTLFSSFFKDSVEVANYSFEQLDLYYSYSFKKSFNGNNVQHKKIDAKNYWGIFMALFLPISIILLYCIFNVVLGSGAWIMRTIILLLLCSLESYLCFALYRLSKFIVK